MTFRLRSALKFDGRIIPEAKYPEGHLRPSGINWGLMPLPLLGRALTGHNYVFLIVS